LGPSDIENSRANLDRQAALGGSFRVLALDGTVLYPPPRASTPSEAPDDLGALGFSTFSSEIGRIRLLREQYVSLGNPVGYLEVEEPLDAADQTMTDVRKVLLGGSLLAGFLMIAAASWLAGRVAGPIRQVSRLSLSIENAEDFSKRLPEMRSPREVADLKDAFNSLLARIEVMVAAQRIFFAESSHELRRPLTVIRTNIDILRMPGLSETRRAALCEDMAVEAAAMSHLLSELLLLSRGESVHTQATPIDYSSLVERSVQLLLDYCADHEVVLDVTPGIFIRGTEHGLCHIVDNLLENAHEYTPAGGSLAVRLHVEAGKAVLEVEDSGVGMTPDEVACAFDRFKRGLAARRLRPEGSGLGLAIVKHFTDGLGGTVEIESKDAVGTTARVRLPVENIQVDQTTTADELLSHRRGNL
jgi:signal transduction histidine kinase